MPMGNQIGNPNFFKLFKGKYELTDVNAKLSILNPYVILTCTNDVVFLFNIRGASQTQSLATSDVLFTLPQECRPYNEETRMLIRQVKNSSGSTNVLNISTNGQVKVASSISSVTSGFTLYTHGLSFNNSSRWYWYAS